MGVLILVKYCGFLLNFINVFFFFVNISYLCPRIRKQTQILTIMEDKFENRNSKKFDTFIDVIIVIALVSVSLYSFLLTFF